MRCAERLSKSLNRIGMVRQGRRVFVGFCGGDFAVVVLGYGARQEPISDLNRVFEVEDVNGERGRSFDMYVLSKI